jgi:hypothetical protein
MRRVVSALAVVLGVSIGWAPSAFACGGLVAPNGAVKLVNTTTLVTYHAGVEHYVTSFQYEGGGSKFGSIIPLPGVPTAVSKGGSWTLQRLEREVNPPARGPAFAQSAAGAASTGAQAILRTQVDALDITVVKGGGPAVTDWVRQQGFAVSPDLGAMLDFYARRSPVFLTATFDAAAEANRGLGLGDGTPVQVTIPTSNPWVPLHILALAKDADDQVQADVFMLTDHQPALLTGPGVTLAASREAELSLLSDLRSDKGMSWIPGSAWLSYLKLNSPASALNYDLAADVSGAARPSLTAAGLSFQPVTLPVPHHPSDVGWWVLGSIGAIMAAFALGGWRATRRYAAERYFHQASL